MRFIVLSLVGIAVLASPCAYDTDPRESSAVFGIHAQAAPVDAPVEFTAPDAAFSDPASAARNGVGPDRG